MESIKIYFRVCPNIDLRRFEEDGGLIVDVRQHTEFLAGHIEGAINIPLEELPHNTHRLGNKAQAIITCCTSGMRSASAKVILESLGYSKVCNGGSWTSLHEKLSYGTTSL
jgi:phage shock protein E